VWEENEYNPPGLVINAPDIPVLNFVLEDEKHSKDPDM
jgi:hypothetical protein